MTQQEQKEFEEKVNSEMRDLTIRSVANGYRAAWQQVVDMLRQGKTKKQIEDYANLIVKNNEKIAEVAIDKDTNN